MDLSCFDLALEVFRERHAGIVLLSLTPNEGMNVNGVGGVDQRAWRDLVGVGHFFVDDAEGIASGNL